MSYYYVKQFVKNGLSHLDSVYDALKTVVYNHATDQFIISYPKAGRTWLRVLIGRALQHYGDVDEKHILDTYKVTAKAKCNKTQFSHDGKFNLYDYCDYRALDFNTDFYKDKGVIFLRRDIRDVLVSHYFHESKRTKTFSGDISDFIRDDIFGVKKVVSFYNLWYNNRMTPARFKLISFEEMKNNPLQVLDEVLDSLNASFVSASAKEEAVAYAAFENLQEKESQHRFRSSRLVPEDTNDPESYKIRKGKVGGYRDYLSSEDVKYIHEVVDEMGMHGCDWYFQQE